jgi:DNA modification methylase
VGPYCTRCAAWRGELGSEPTPEQYVANLVAVFREVRRVLHPSGVCIVNLGDSYAGSGKGPSNSLQPDASQLSKQTTSKGSLASINSGKVYAGYKAKDLMQMPFKVAEALRQDGWYLRSTMCWLKRAAMPESVTDRPSNALEWLFLFSKAPRYFWDAEAIRQRVAPASIGRLMQDIEAQHGSKRANGGAKTNGTMKAVGDLSGRAFRNTDPWFLSLDAAIADARADLARLEAMRATGGVLAGDDGLPLAVDINPAAYKEAHFATYPPALVIPFVKAGTSERGACPRCLAPWGRVVERAFTGDGNPLSYAERAVQGSRMARDGAAHAEWKRTNPNRDRGWQPSCACDAGEPQPCVVLDPFSGSGTSLLVADRLGRDAVGVELSPEYARMAEARIAGDAPLLNGLAEFEPEVVQDKQGALGKRTYTGFNGRWKVTQEGMAEVEATAGDYAPLGLFGEAAS